MFAPLLVSKTGSHVAAATLGQIMYWHQGRLKIKRRNTYWLVKSRTEMCEETGMTLDQYKRVIPKLIAQGWIVTERGLFQNKITPFIQLTAAGHDLMRECLMGTPLVQKDANPLVQGCSNPLVQYAANPLTDTTSDTTSVSPCEDASSKTRETMKAIDVLKKKKADTHTSSIQAFWQKRCEAVIGGYQHPLTQKQVGQLKMLEKYLGPRTREVIDYALNNWMKFSHVAGIEEGGLSPSDPHIGFLLKHHAIVVNMLWPVEVQLIAPLVQKTEYHQIVEEKPDKAKQQELLKAMLADFK